MSRNATLEVPPKEALSPSASGQQKQPEKPIRRAGEPGAAAKSLQGHELFREALLEMSSTRPGRRTLDFIVSVILHAVVLTLIILVPLAYTESIDLRAFTRTFLVAPPPPPPPPPPPAAAAVAKVAKAPRRVFTAGGKLIAPTAIPKEVAIIKEEALPPDVGLGIGVEGGVPGGVPGGQLGGVIGGIIGSSPRSQLPPPPPPPAPRAPVRVGGRVMAPKLLYGPQPEYPVLAKQAKIQGDVILDAVIDTQGNVVELSVISGHPLLVPAALAAVRQWKYQPTYLNDEPISVQLHVTVRFRLE